MDLVENCEDDSEERAVEWRQSAGKAREADCSGKKGERKKAATESWSLQLQNVRRNAPQRCPSSESDAGSVGVNDAAFCLADGASTNDVPRSAASSFNAASLFRHLRSEHSTKTAPPARSAFTRQSGDLLYSSSLLANRAQLTPPLPPLKSHPSQNPYSSSRPFQLTGAHLGSSPNGLAAPSCYSCALPTDADWGLHAKPKAPLGKSQDPANACCCSRAAQPHFCSKCQLSPDLLANSYCMTQRTAKADLYQVPGGHSSDYEPDGSPWEQGSSPGGAIGATYPLLGLHEGSALKGTPAARNGPLDRGSQAGSSKRSVGSSKRASAAEEPLKGCYVSRVQGVVLILFFLLATFLVALLVGFVSATLAWQSCVQSDPKPRTPAHMQADDAPTPSTLRPDLPWYYGRLPRFVVPSIYYLHLQIDPDAPDFTGVTRIHVTCLQPTRFLLFHAVGLTFDPAHVQFIEESSNIPLAIAKQFAFNDYYVLQFHYDLVAQDTYIIVVQQYVAKYDTNLRGLFRSTYFEPRDERPRNIIATQLEPSDARRVFPSFDEPDFKANFSITVTQRNLTGYTTLSNMPEEKSVILANGWVKRTFKTTPVMATYLVAVVVTDFKSRPNRPDAPLAIGIWAPQSRYADTEFALEAVSKLYNYFQASLFAGINEIVPKSDHVALPEHSALAMENWGLITYVSTSLLYTSGVSSSRQKESIATVIAHEIAHSWFGNMVTMQWWNDLWLNEAFASLLMYKAVNDVYPEFDLGSLPLLESTFAVMPSDSLASSHPIRAAVNSASQSIENFDDISYKKGMAILHMLNRILGEDSFRLCLNKFIRQYMFKNANMEQLWSSFSRVDLDVRAVMGSWLEMAGVPLVTIRRQSSRNRTEVFQLRQERFYYRRSADDFRLLNTDKFWAVPFTYRYLNGYAENPVAIKWFNQSHDLLVLNNVRDNSVVIGNIDCAGYYLVDYDIEIWETITSLLNTDYQRFSVEQRSCLLFSAFSLARIGRVSYEVALRLASYLKMEDHFIPWATFVVHHRFLSSMLGASWTFGAYQDFVSGLVRNRLDLIDFRTISDGSVSQIRYRAVILRLACDLGLKKCQDYARNTFEHAKQYAVSPLARLAVDYKATILSETIRSGGADEWNYLWNWTAQATVSDRQMILEALVNTRIPWLLNRLLYMLVNNEGISRSDAGVVMHASDNSPLTRMVYLQFFLHNWPDINKRYGSDVFFLRTVLNNLNFISSRDDLDRLNATLITYPPPPHFRKAVLSLMDSISCNVYWRQTREDNLIESINKVH